MASLTCCQIETCDAEIMSKRTRNSQSIEEEAEEIEPPVRSSSSSRHSVRSDGVEQVARQTSKYRNSTEEEDVVRVPHFDFSPDITLKDAELTVNAKEMANFENISVDAQAQCIKAVVRLFVMKGMLKISGR